MRRDRGHDAPPVSITDANALFMRFQPLATASGVVALAALAIAHAVRTPDVKPADSPVAVFSADRAMAHVRELSRAPRPVGSAGHDHALVYIMARLAALGIEPRIQATTGIGTRYPVAGRVRNIVARIPGMRPATEHGAVLLMAHYDGVAAAPGAGDDASGVAVLLETMRAIRNGPLLANDVIALFTDSEESGLLGAAAFVREHAWARDVGVILNFEARGTHGPSLMFETGPANYDVLRFLRSVPGARATSLSTAVYRQLPNDTDMSELAVLNRPAMNFAFIGGVERYHTAEDDVAHLSAGSVQHHGNQALALARAFANARLPRPPAAGDGVFFDLPVAGLVLYPDSWAMPLALVAAAAAVLLLTLAARRDARAYGGAAIGAVLFVASLVIAALAAGGIAQVSARLHASLPWGGSPQWSAVHALANALTTVAIVTAVMALAARLSGGRVRAFMAGALTMLAAAGAFIALVMPGASFLFTWPTLAAAVAGLTGMSARRAAALAAWWIATATVLFIIAPTAYLMVCVALGLDFTGAAILAILTAMSVWLVAAACQKDAALRWRLPAVTGGVALALMAVGVFSVRTSPRHPAGSTIVYAVDSAAGSAWLAGTATNGWARAWLERELRSRGDSAPPVDVPSWLARSYPARTMARAPLVPVATPTASIVHDSSTAAARIVTLRVSAPGAHSVQLSTQSSAVIGAVVDGREVHTDRYRSGGRSRRWTLDYVAAPDSGFSVSLSLRPGTDHVLSIVARHPGIPAGVAVPPRPAGVIPIGGGDATLVHRSVRLDSTPVTATTQ